MKSKIQLMAVFMLLFASNSWGQYWNTVGLNNGFGGNTFGTYNNAPINIYTSGIHRALFTTGNALTTWNGNAGDGLRIVPPAGTSGTLDLATKFMVKM